MNGLQAGQVVRISEEDRLLAGQVVKIVAVAPQYSSSDPEFQYYSWENGLEVEDMDGHVWWVFQSYVSEIL